MGNVRINVNKRHYLLDRVAIPLLPHGVLPVIDLFMNEITKELFVRSISVV